MGFESHLVIFLVSADGEMVHFFSYLSGFVHCFVGY